METLDINLEDLIPSPASFKLSEFPEFEFKLTPCTGGKLVKMSKDLGNIEDLLGMPTAENVAKVSLSLMEFDSAVKFKMQKVKSIDVLTGKESEDEVGGYVLLMNCITGLNEQYSIYKAILLSMGYNKENADKLIKKLKDGIKEVMEKELNKPDKLKKKKKKKKR